MLTVKSMPKYAQSKLMVVLLFHYKGGNQKAPQQASIDFYEHGNLIRNDKSALHVFVEINLVPDETIFTEKRGGNLC